MARGWAGEACQTCQSESPETYNVCHGSYRNNEIKLRYIPGWIELNYQDILTQYIYIYITQAAMAEHLGAIQVLRNADGGGGVSDFLEKSITKVQCSMLLA